MKIIIAPSVMSNSCRKHVAILSTRSLLALGKPTYKNNLHAHWAVAINVFTVMI